MLVWGYGRNLRNCVRDCVRAVTVWDWPWEGHNWKWRILRCQDPGESEVLRSTPSLEEELTSDCCSLYRADSSNFVVVSLSDVQ